MILTFTDIHIIRICTSCILLILSFQTQAQENHEKEITKADSLVKVYEIARARELCLTEADRSLKNEDCESYVRLMLKAAEINTKHAWKVEMQPDYRWSLEILSRIENSCSHVIMENEEFYSDLLYLKGLTLDWLGSLVDTDSIMDLFNRALNMRKIIFGEQSEEVADCYYGIAEVYKYQYPDFDSAWIYYAKSYKIYEEVLGKNDLKVGAILMPMGDIQRDRFKLNEAFNMYYRSQEIYKFNNVPSYRDLAQLYERFANAFARMQDFEEVVRYNMLAIKELKKIPDFTVKILETSYRSLAGAYVRLGEAKKGLAYADSALDLMTNKSLYFISTLRVKGEAYLSLGEYDKSRKIFEYILNNRIKELGEQATVVAEIYKDLARVDLKKKEFINALDNIQKGIISLHVSFNNSDYHVNPVLESIHDPQVMSEYLFLKGHILFKYSKSEESLNPDLQNTAMECFTLGWRCLNLAKKQINEEYSQAYLLQTLYRSEYYESGILCALELFEKSEENRFMDLALRFIETGMYGLVYEAIQRAELEGELDISTDLTDRIAIVNRKLDSLKIEMDTVRDLGQEFNRERNEITNRTSELIEERDRLVSQMRTQYPEYYQVKYDEYFLGINEIQQKLDDNTSIMEYYWGENYVILIVISKNEVYDYRLDRTSVHDEELVELQQMLISQVPVGSGKYYEFVELYDQRAHSVYQELVGPYLDQSEYLVIIPDGPLTLIPIEALVTSILQKPDKKFKDLNYLLKSRNVMYAYSVNISFETEFRKEEELENILAFSYGDLNLESWEFRKSSFQQLPGTNLEVEAIRAIFDNVTAFREEDAIKSNFLDNAAGYDVLHLALHGIGDKTDILRSSLIFQPGENEKSWGYKMYAHEIYGLDLNASLVVLSACESGSGKYTGGEGIFSIARGFAYAGCPSNVMSLWRVTDKFTPRIMTEFYRNLNNGLPLSQSLREAKLTFLSKSDEFSSFPGNWAAFIASGKDVSFVTEGDIKIWQLLLPSVVILVLIVVMIKRKARVS